MRVEMVSSCRRSVPVLTAFLAVVAIVTCGTAVSAFVPSCVENSIPTCKPRSTESGQSCAVAFKSRTAPLQLAKGFGGTSSNSNSNGGGRGKKKLALTKSYGKEALQPISDIIDSEGAMKEFFATNEKWHPLFRSMAFDSDVPAMSFLASANRATNLTDSDSALEWDAADRPWTQNEAVPQTEVDRNVLSDFLDRMQNSLVDIPVDETTKEDDFDMHFLEEGRRVLVLSRFHVLQNYQQGSIDSHDQLFAKCWSELMQLHLDDTSDSGSLIIVPNTDLPDLRRFTSMNIQQPLRWLGIDSDIEVTSYERGYPAIRFIYKLSDMPTDVGK